MRPPRPPLDLPVCLFWIFAEFQLSVLVHVFTCGVSVCLVQNNITPTGYIGYLSKTQTLGYHYKQTDNLVFNPAWYSGSFHSNSRSPTFLHTCVELTDTAYKMSSVKQITRRHSDKPKAKACGHFINPFDSHVYCPSCRESGTVRAKQQGDPCMLGQPCPICQSFSQEQLDKIANRRKYQKKSRPSTHRPDLSGDLETAESDISISAEKEATLLDLSEEAQPQAEHTQEPLVQTQAFQGREPPVMLNVAKNPISHSTPIVATTAVPATPWRVGLQMEMQSVRQEISSHYVDMRQSIVAEMQACMQATVQAQFQHFLGPQL